MLIKYKIRDGFFLLLGGDDNDDEDIGCGGEVEI